MPIYATNAVGMDLSHYDHNIDAALLKGNVDFLTVKAGGTDAPGGAYLDARFAERVQMAYDIGALCGAYWFVNPRYWLEWSGGTGMSMKTIDGMTDDEHPLLKIIMAQLKNKLIYWLAFDVEKNSLPSNYGTVTDVWIRYYIADLIERIQRQQAKGNMRKFKMGIYSSRNFMDTSGKEPPQPQLQLSTYLGQQPDVFIWTANWVNGTGATLSLPQIKALRPSDLHIPYSYGYSAARPKTWQFFQWSGDNARVYKTPSITNDKGIPIGLDLNLFNGTVAELKAWAGVGTTPPPIPTPEPGALTCTQAERDMLDAMGAWVKAA